MKKIFIALLSLFLFSFPTVSASSMIVYLGGQTVTIQADYDGVLISGMYDFKVNDEWVSPKNTSELEVGDKIIAIENQAIHDLEGLYQYLSIHPRGTALYEVTIIRDHMTMKKKLQVTYLEEEKVFKTGLYVKDKIKGIGTVTFYNPTNKTWAALGHEIMESDLKKRAEISSGELFLASVNEILPSTPNKPGEKNCINLLIPIGSIVKNTPYGLYGFYEDTAPLNEKIEIGSQEEAHTGEATMLTVFKDKTILPVKIMILHINKQKDPSIKGIEFEIIDPYALKASGGIVQGMSGSPIIQDNRLIGAVTHMVTSTPNRGYGIHIQWMFNESMTLH